MMKENFHSEYSPLRKAYAWTGFLTLLIGLGLAVARVEAWWEYIGSIPAVNDCAPDTCYYLGDDFSGDEAPEHLKVKKGDKGYYKDYCAALPKECK